MGMLLYGIGVMVTKITEADYQANSLTSQLIHLWAKLLACLLTSEQCVSHIANIVSSQFLTYHRT